MATNPMIQAVLRHQHQQVTAPGQTVVAASQFAPPPDPVPGEHSEEKEKDDGTKH